MYLGPGQVWGVAPSSEHGRWCHGCSREVGEPDSEEVNTHRRHIQMIIHGTIIQMIIHGTAETKCSAMRKWWALMLRKSLLSSHWSGYLDEEGVIQTMWGASFQIERSVGMKKPRHRMLDILISLFWDRGSQFSLGWLSTNGNLPPSASPVLESQVFAITLVIITLGNTQTDQWVWKAGNKWMKKGREVLDPIFNDKKGKVYEFCISYSLLWKDTQEKLLKEIKVYYFFHLEESPSWWQECGAASYIAPIFRKQRQRNKGSQLTFLFFFTVGLQPMRWFHPWLGWVFPYL